jgi:tetratricopeptide (TPR) repeat protein
MHLIRLAVIVVAAIWSGATSAQTLSASDPDTVACTSQANWEIRVSGCTRLLEHRRWPNNIQGTIYLQRGLAYGALARYDEALADFGQAITFLPNSAQSFQARGNAYTMLGKPELGVDDLTRAIQIDAKFAVAYKDRAYALIRLRQIDRAMADLDTAIRLDPKLAAAFLLRSEANRSLARTSQAIDDASAAIKLAPNASGAYKEHGMALGQAGDYDRAMADFDKAISLSPRSADNYYSRALAWIAKTDGEHALSDLDEAIRLNPKLAAALNARCNELRKRNDADAAIADCNAAIALDPLSATFLVNRAAVWFRRGDLDRTTADLDSAIRLDPDNPNAYVIRGNTLQTRGELTRALADFDRAIAISPKYARAYASRGQLHEARSETAAARLDYQAAVALPETIQVAGRQGVYNLSSKRELDFARARLALLADQGATDQPSAPATGRRAALVIGNGRYVTAPQLSNPPNDARLIAAKMRAMGFEVAEGIDLDRAAMTRTITDFLRAAATAKIAVVFYAGHGMQVDGHNYLVPVDGDFRNSADIAKQALDVDFILAGLDDALRANIVILDACRDNPLLGRRLNVSTNATGAVGLATPANLGAGAAMGAGTLLAFATAPGKTALDGDGDNSPFSLALSHHIATPGLEVQQMLTRVRSDVVTATKGAQVPWSSSSLLGEVQLAPQ